MESPQGDFTGTARTALDIAHRMQGDLAEVRTALDGGDDKTALRLMRKFFRPGATQEGEHERKHATNSGCNTGERAAG